MAVDPPDRARTHDTDLREAFHASIEEGHDRLNRSTSSLAATGLIGGLDVGLGVLSLLVVEARTGSRVLGALGFMIGFLALHLGRSELFTENFLVPVTTVVAGRDGIGALLRLWAVTLVANLIAGLTVAFLIAFSLPSVAETAIHSATFYAERTNLEAASLGLLAGMAITLMTWMVQGSRSELGELASVMGIAFLLAAVPLNHVIVVSIDMFAGLQAGATFGVLGWLRVAGIAVVTNLIGGVVLVTSLRVLQLGRSEIEKVRG